MVSSAPLTALTMAFSGSVERLEHFGLVDLDDAGPALAHAAAAHFHRVHRLAVAGGAQRLLDVLGGPLADEQPVASAHEADDRLVHVVAGGADGAGVDHAAERDHGDVGGAAADVDDHAAGGFGDRQPGADGRGHRLVDEVHFAGLGPIRAVDDRPALHLGDARRDADDEAGASPGDAALRLSDEVAQQPLGGLEIGDHAVAQRPDRGDVGRGAAQHRVRRVPDRLGLVALRVDGDDGRLVDDDAAPRREHDGVRRTEVDCEVASAEGQDVEQHVTPELNWANRSRQLGKSRAARTRFAVFRAALCSHVSGLTTRRLIELGRIARCPTQRTRRLTDRIVSAAVNVLT